MQSQKIGRSAAIYLLLLAGQAAAPAAELTWTSVGPLLFYDTAGNWNPMQTPTNSDNVTFGIDVMSTPIIIGASSAAMNVNVIDNQWEFTGAAGGRLTSAGQFTIDDVLGTSLIDGASLTLTDALSWDNAGDIFVAGQGYGDLRVETGSDLRGQDVIIGSTAGSVGQITVDGAGSRLQTDGPDDGNGFVIGDLGTGMLHVTNGGLARIVNDVSGSIANFDLGNQASGNGTLNIDGAGSQVIAEDALIGNAGHGTLHITNGGAMLQNVFTSPDAFVAQQTDSSGHVIVNGDGSQWQMARLEIGNLGDATLSIESGGFVRSNSNDMTLADAGGTGRVAIFGSGATNSRLEVANDLYVGNLGRGELFVGRDLNGAADGSGRLQVGSDLFIGTGPGTVTDNKVVVSGANANATIGERLWVGRFGKGSFEANQGATITVGTSVSAGSEGGGDGSIVLDGPGTTLTAGSLFLGNANGSPTSTGVMTVRNQAVATFSGAGNGVITVGDDPNSVGTLTVTGAGSRIETTGGTAEWWIGGSSNDNGGTGTLNVFDGGQAASSGRVVLGYNSGASGTLHIDGTNSEFDVNGDFLLVGFGGLGNADVTGGGNLHVNNILVADAAGSAGSQLDIDGTGSVVSIAGRIYIGDTNRGTLNITNGGQLNVATTTPSARLIIGDEGAADGSKLTVSGANSRVDYHGTADIAVGNAGGANTGNMDDRATLEVNNGGVFSAVQRDAGNNILSQARIIIGDVDGGNGRILVNGPGSLAEASVIYVGDGTTGSSGILDVQNGGVATTTGEFQAGSNGNGVGTVNVDGVNSSLTVGTTLSLGDDIPGNGAATGNLNITAGGVVTNGGQAYIGHYTGSFGTATLASTTTNVSTWNIGGELTLAGTETSSQTSGFGTLNINSGGRVSIASNLRIRNLGDVNLNGGEIVVGDALIFTDLGSTFNFQSGTLRLANSAGYTLSDDQLTRLLGPNPTLTSDKSLIVDGVAVLSSPLRLNGGTFSVGGISTGNFANVDFDAGTFELTNNNLNVSTNGLFGPMMVLGSQQTVNVVAGTTNIATGASLNVIGGGFNTASATNDGIVIVSQTAAVDFDADNSGDGLVNNGRLLLVDATVAGLVSGPGAIQAVGAAGVGGLSMSSSSSVEFLLSGTGAGQFDTLQVSGAATLAGTLIIELASTLTPVAGDAFEIITATGGRTGTFDSLALPSLGSGLSWNLNYGTHNAVLSVLSGSLPGDFNGDGNYDCADVDSLVADIASGQNTIEFDLNGDGLVDGSDLSDWLVLAGGQNLPTGNAYLLGDANLDGTVDGQDFVAWNANKFTATAAWCAGDFTADGLVDGQDFLVWNNNKFSSADSVSVVPEPSLALVSMVCCAWLRLSLRSLSWLRCR